MRIAILGYGTLGKNTAHFSKIHDVKIYDPFKEGYETQLAGQYDIVLVCTHEDQVLPALMSFRSMASSKIIVVRSTTDIGTCFALEDRFRIPVYHLPEFSTERDLESLKSPEYFVIGTSQIACEEERQRFLKYLIQTFPSTKLTFLMKQSHSEFVKLVTNSYLGTQISFWNDVFELSKHLFQEDYLDPFLGFIDKRIGIYGRNPNLCGKPFSGKCLPKDIVRLVRLFEDINMPTSVLKTAWELNEARMHATEHQQSIPKMPSTSDICEKGDKE